jgi:hypothetical protein
MYIQLLHSNTDFSATESQTGLPPARGDLDHGESQLDHGDLKQTSVMVTAQRYPFTSALVL